MRKLLQFIIILLIAISCDHEVQTVVNSIVDTIYISKTDTIYKMTHNFVNTHSIDTVYVSSRDTIITINKDSVFIYRSDTVYVVSEQVSKPEEKEEDSEFIIYRAIDFENMTVGICTEDTLKKYFPDYYEIVYHSSNLVDIIEIDGDKVFSIENGPPYNGFGMEIGLSSDRKDYFEIYYSYDAMFSLNYKANDQAKIPGIRGYPWPDGMGGSERVCPTGHDGFNAIYLFDGNSLYSYNYDKTNHSEIIAMNGKDFGGGCPWAIERHHFENVVIENGKWYTITQRIVINSFTNGIPNPDGIRETWINGQMIFQEFGHIFMEIDSQDMGADIQRIGHFKNTRTDPPDWAYFNNFYTWIYKNHDITGHDLHDPNQLLQTP